MSWGCVVDAICRPCSQQRERCQWYRDLEPSLQGERRKRAVFVLDGALVLILILYDIGAEERLIQVSKGTPRELSNLLKQTWLVNIVA